MKKLFFLCLILLWASTAFSQIRIGGIRGTGKLNRIESLFTGTSPYDLTVTSVSGNGAGLTGITGATGGVANTGSTTIGADTDEDDVGTLSLQTKLLDRLTIAPDGSLFVAKGISIGSDLFAIAGDYTFGKNNSLEMVWTASGDDDTTYFAFGKTGFSDIGADPGLTLKRNNMTTRMAFNWVTDDTVRFITGFDAPLTNDLVLAYNPNVVHSLGTGGDNLRISPTTGRINIGPNSGTPTVDSTGAQLQVRPDSTYGHVVSGMTIYIGTSSQAGTHYTHGVQVNADTADAFKITDLSSAATNWIAFNQGNGTTDWRIGRQVDASNNFHLETYYAANAVSDANTPGRRQQRLWSTGEMSAYGPQGGLIITSTSSNLQTATNAVTADWDTASIAVLSYATAFAPGPAIYFRASDGDALNLAIATDDHLYFQNGSGYVYDENIDILTPTDYGTKVTTAGTVDGLLLDKTADGNRNWTAWQQGTGAWRAGMGASPYELLFYYSASSPTASSPGNELFAITPASGIRIGDGTNFANIAMQTDTMAFANADLYYFTGNGLSINSPATTFGYQVTVSTDSLDGINIVKGNDDDRNWFSWTQGTAGWRAGMLSSPYSFALFYTANGSAEAPGTQVLTMTTAGALQLNAYGAGTLVTDGSGNVTASSDARLKDVKGQFTSGLDALKPIRPVYYKWNKKSGMETDGLYAGFIAQNVEQTLAPAVYTHPKTGMKSLNTTTVLAAAVNAINELEARVAALENEIKELKK